MFLFITKRLIFSWRLQHEILVIYLIISFHFSPRLLIVFLSDFNWLDRRTNHAWKLNVTSDWQLGTYAKLDYGTMLRFMLINFESRSDSGSNSSVKIPPRRMSMNFSWISLIIFFREFSKNALPAIVKNKKWCASKYANIFRPREENINLLDFRFLLSFFVVVVFFSKEIFFRSRTKDAKPFLRHLESWDEVSVETPVSSHDPYWFHVMKLSSEQAAESPSS